MFHRSELSRREGEDVGFLREARKGAGVIGQSMGR